jgi:predicted nucleic acid-binding protein
MTAAQTEPPVRPSANVAVRVMVDSAHRQNAALPVNVPDKSGLFPPAFLPETFPAVVDANALRDDLLRVAAGRGRTLMLKAANSGILRLFCAPHVLDEVDEHLVEWSAHKRLDPAVVRAAWESDLAPLLRCVDVPDGLTTAAEQKRLDYLGLPPETKYCDPDDVPTATLALLINAPLLSKDRAPLRAVYGEPFDHVAHAQWLGQLSAVGDLGPLGRLAGAIDSLLGLAASGAFQGVAAAARRVPWPWLLVGAVAAAGAFRYLIAPETRQRVQATLGAGLASAGATVMEVVNAREAARGQFESLLPVQPGWDEVVASRGTGTALTRASLFHLARSPQSDLSASELAAVLLRHTDGFPRGEAKVRAALRREPAFNEPYRGRFQVGAPALDLGDTGTADVATLRAGSPVR